MTQVPDCQKVPNLSKKYQAPKERKTRLVSRNDRRRERMTRKTVCFYSSKLKDQEQERKIYRDRERVREGGGGEIRRMVEVSTRLPRFLLKDRREEKRRRLRNVMLVRTLGVVAGGSTDLTSRRSWARDEKESNGQASEGTSENWLTRCTPLMRGSISQDTGTRLPVFHWYSRTWASGRQITRYSRTHVQIVYHDWCPRATRIIFRFLSTRPTDIEV